MGKEWTTANGDFENNNPQYIKVVSTGGHVSIFLTNQLFFNKKIKLNISGLK